MNFVHEEDFDGDEIQLAIALSLSEIQPRRPHLEDSPLQSNIQEAPDEGPRALRAARRRRLRTTSAQCSSESEVIPSSDSHNPKNRESIHTRKRIETRKSKNARHSEKSPPITPEIIHLGIESSPDQIQQTIVPPLAKEIEFPDSDARTISDSLNLGRSAEISDDASSSLDELFNPETTEDVGLSWKAFAKGLELGFIEQRRKKLASQTVVGDRWRREMENRLDSIDVCRRPVLVKRPLNPRQQEGLLAARKGIFERLRGTTGEWRLTGRDIREAVSSLGIPFRQEDVDLMIESIVFPDRLSRGKRGQKLSRDELMVKFCDALQSIRGGVVTEGVRELDNAVIGWRDFCQMFDLTKLRVESNGQVW